MSDSQHWDNAAGWIAILLASSSGCGAEASATTPGETDQTVNTYTSEAEECRAEYPAGEPFDVGDTSLDEAVAPNARPEAGAVLPSVQTIAEACKAGGGLHCSPAEFMSRSAALCIAQTNDMLPSDERLRRAGLKFSEAERIVQWSIELTYPSPSDPYCGRLLLIKVDAVSGSVLSRDTLGYCS